MAGAGSLPNKQDVARALLLKGTLFVHLDPRSEHVFVPQWLTRQPQLVLQVGLDMPVPITDLRLDEVGVYGTLSFNRTAFTCSVPWEAVFALVGDDGRGMVWPNSMPPEIAAEVEREAHRVRPAATDDGTVANIEQPRKRRSSSSPSAPKAPQLPAQRAKRAALRLPGLELIAGQGDRMEPARRSERRALPPYLRVVK